MVELEIRNSNNLRQDYNQMICSTQRFMALQDLIANTTSLYIEYWEELLKSKPCKFYGIK